jgi:hypothetical protein
MVIHFFENIPIKTDKTVTNFYVTVIKIVFSSSFFSSNFKTLSISIKILCERGEKIDSEGGGHNIFWGGGKSLKTSARFFFRATHDFVYRASHGIL